jgi:type VI secretion system protein ImpK
MSAVAVDAFVLSSFRTFYALLIELQEAVEADPWAASARSLPEEVSGARQARVTEIQGRLRDLIQRMETEARQAGGEREGRRFSDAAYVMAALADESFLALDWEGRQIWAQSLLESRLFGTHVAGERVFERAETLLRDRDDREMATVMLLALSLGFEGQHRGRGSEGHAAVQDLKARLLAFTSGGGGPVSDAPHLFPQAYAHTLQGKGEVHLPRVTRWSLVLAAVLVAYLLGSHVLWLDASSSIRTLAEEILAIGSAGGALR